MSDVYEVARARIAEIDRKLGDMQTLVDERTHLQSIVDWYEEHRKQVPLFRPNIVELRPKVVVSDDNRFRPRANSNTSKIVKAIKTLLQAHPDHLAPFPVLVDAIPREIAGGGEHWKEAVRTAIKRAGGREGIVYETGGVVRLLTKSPQAMEA